ncbi:MAG: hypothetical protein JWR02_2282 [Mucilaginibacter sp.]|nr:hypothetical protein [Mucilaginibacter sp.]
MDDVFICEYRIMDIEPQTPKCQDFLSFHPIIQIRIFSVRYPTGSKEAAQAAKHLFSHSGHFALAHIISLFHSLIYGNNQQFF